jgi:hypothetical protein
MAGALLSQESRQGVPGGPKVVGFGVGKGPSSIL